MNQHSILLVVTSHDRIDADHATGLWFEEFAIPYNAFLDQGYRVAVASPSGGEAPVDPRSVPEDRTSPDSERAIHALAQTETLRDVDVSSYDAVFFPGGHGTMFDFPQDPHVASLVAEYFETGKVVAAVCHGPAAFVNARLSNGRPAVQGRRLTAFTNQEERAVELDRLMPFLLESALRELGAHVSTAPAWSDHIVVDDRLITGQNPQSSASTAAAVIKTLA